MKRIALLDNGATIPLEENLIEKNNMLYNTTLSRYEALPGDAIKIKIDGEVCRYHMRSYSNGNVFQTREMGEVKYDGKFFRVVHKVFISSVVEEPDDEPKVE